jgi:hypothetical protein
MCWLVQHKLMLLYSIPVQLYWSDLQLQQVTKYMERLFNKPRKATGSRSRKGPHAEISCSGGPGSLQNKQ